MKNRGAVWYRSVFRGQIGDVLIYIALFCALGFAFFWYRSFLDDRLSWGDDWGIYLQIAHNIYYGLPYNHLILGVSAAPGYPTILAATAFISSWDLADLKISNTISILIISLSSFCISRIFLNKIISLFLSLVMLTLVGLVSFQTILYSDLVGNALCLVTIYIYLLAMSNIRLSKFWPLMATSVILSFSALLIRPAALPVSVAIIFDCVFLALFFYGKEQRIKLIVCAISAATLLVAYLYIYADTVILTHLNIAGLGQWQQDDSLLALLKRDDWLTELGPFFQGRWERELPNISILGWYFPVHPVRTVVFCVLAVLGAIWIGWRYRYPVLFLFISASSMMILLPTFSGGHRYWMSAFVIATIAVFVFISDISKIIIKKFIKNNYYLYNTCNCIVVISCVIVLSVWLRHNVKEINSIDWASLIDEDVHGDPDIANAMAWITTHVKENVMITGFKGRALSYLTQRPVSGMPIDQAFSPEPLSVIMGKLQAQYIVLPTQESILAMDWNLGPKAVAGFMAKAESDGRLKLVYETRKLQVYELLNANF